MSKINANSYELAVKEVKAFDERLAEKVPQTIKAEDKNHYVVLLVRKVNNPAKKRYDVSFNLQTFDKRSIEKATKNVEQNGFDKLIILHNPTIETSETPVQEGAPAKTETAEEIEARIRAEYEKKYAGADVVAESVTGAGAGTADTQSTEETATGAGVDAGTDGEDVSKKLKRLTKEELIAFAGENEIDITGLQKKDEILEALLSWNEDQKA